MSFDQPSARIASPEIVTLIDTVVGHHWDREQADYYQQDPDHRSGHIFDALSAILSWLEAPGELVQFHEIVSAWSSGEEKDRALRSHLIDIAPDDTRASLAAAALERLDAYQEHHWSFSFDGIYRRLAAELAPEIVDRLVAGRYDGELAADLLDLLINHSPDLARSLCHRLRTHHDPAIARLARRGQASLDPDSVVDDLITADIDADELADLLRPLDITALDDTRLHRLTRVLLDRYPYGADPDFMSEDYSPNSVYSIRDRLLVQLAARGDHVTLALLRENRPDLDRTVLAAHLRRACEQATNLAYTPLDPADLLTLLSQADTRLIRTADDLLDVVLENLRELQHQITNRGAFNDLWNLGEPPFPKAEDIISDWIQRNLNPLLGTTAVIEREPQARRVRPRGTGTRMDLTVTAPIATQPGSTARVIIEAKLVNHPDLLTSLHEQLVERYLQRTRTRHGIYLVYWVDPTWRPSDWTSAHRRDTHALQQQLTEQAAQVDAEYVVHPFLLDITPPYPPSAPRTGE
ncbi:hypothetical protein [Saccharothrix luteola]|uniref:hypothetical protein n=1 Tax=Saccharothrix luteola TaxID=2893018 RepID=UPI001E5FB930|nr:hypothetical protein [Saccharothrix luteola]MCC8250508.1 hypothetical protein [Saccharothrix luteola]